MVVTMVAFFCPAGLSGASQNRLAPALPASGPYLAQLKHYSTEIASHIGHPLSLSLAVTVNSTQQEGAKVEAYALATDNSGGSSGAPARCTIHVNPLLYKSSDTAEANLAFAHEVFHCFEAMDYPTIAAFAAAPDWLIEGEAEWVGDALAPGSDAWWDGYLTKIKTPLFSRSYDAVGFYALVNQSGQDTWHLLDPMLKAGGSAAAYSLAANTTLRQDWGSSFARESDLGKGWAIEGPGITSEKYQPATSALNVGTVLTSTVAPYTNALIKFDPSADVVTVTASTPYSRMHEASGENVINLSGSNSNYCVHDCDKCPEMEAMPKLTAGTTWLAVTGDSAGAKYSVTGGPPMCSCLLGTWTVTQETGFFTGGSGVSWTFMPNNSIAVNYDGSAPVVGPGGTNYTYSGSATYTTNLPESPPDSGSYTATPISQAVSATYTIPGLGSKTTAVTETAHNTQYTCSGNSLTLHIVAAGGNFDYTLTRGGH